ncbi:MAG: 3-oxoacyl-[acyl-carrier-protein] reductase [Alphaproteobacteria bacterium]|nr:3-oxoacyl-[acyl-carrier-protein] reductase [Alphaproteobacteria bacterium]
MFELDLTGKTALITGATGGIGSAITRALHSHGATIGLVDRNRERLDKTAAVLGSRFYEFEGDLRDRDFVASIIPAAEKEMGQIDILVNNAGVTRDNLSMRMKEEDWDEVIEVNLSVPFKLAQAVQRSMMKRRWGRIINIASVVGFTGNPGQCNYVSSKAGIVGWSKAMAQELASRGITVNCVAPGFIASPMTDALTDEQKDKINRNIALGRMGTADEVAAAVMFLATNEAGYITGQTIHVNGGLAMI